MPTRGPLLESSLTHLRATVAAVSEDLMFGVFANVTKTPARNSATNAIPASIERRCCLTSIPAPFSSRAPSPKGTLGGDTRSRSGGNACARPRAAARRRSGRADDHHRAGSVIGDLVGHRAEQEALGAGHALVADDDQVGCALLRHIDDRVRGVSLARVRVDLHARLPREVG